MLCHVPPERQKYEEEQGPAQVRSNTNVVSSGNDFLLTKEQLLLDFCCGRRADLFQPKKQVRTTPF